MEMREGRKDEIAEWRERDREQKMAKRQQGDRERESLRGVTV